MPLPSPDELSASPSLPPTSRRLTPTSLLAQTLQTNQPPTPSSSQGPPSSSLPHPSALPPHLLMAGGSHPPFKSSSSAGSSSTVAPPPVAGPSGTSGLSGGAGQGGQVGGRSSGGGGAGGAGKKSRPLKHAEEGDDQGDEEDGRETKRRKRIDRACFGCRQRRSKCDGGTPCAICINNNAECTYPPPPRRVTIKYVEELEQKLASLESTSQISSIPSAGRDSNGNSNGTPSIPSDSPSGPPYHANPPPLLPPHQSSYPPSGSSSSRQDMGPPQHHPHQQYPYPQHLPFQPQAYHPQQQQQHQQQQQQQQQYDQNQHQQQNYFQDEDHPQRQEDHRHMQQNYPRPSLSSQPSNPYFSAVPPQPHPSSQFTHSQPFASTSSASYPPSNHQLHQQHQPMPNAYQPSMSNASFAEQLDPNLSRAEDHGLVRRDAVEREFSPGQSSEEEDRDVAMDGTGSGGARFETHPMVDRTSRWERQGQDGVSTELVENAAARLAGQVVKASRLHPTGQPQDAFVTQALALSPRSIANGLSATVGETGGESAVKGQTRDVRNLQQRVFAKYDLPERKVADDLLAFYNDKVHPLYPILHWPSVLKKYEQVWTWPTEEHLIAADHIFLATLNILFCITCALRSGKDDNIAGGVYFRRSQTLMSVPFILLMGNVQIIDYLLLLCQYSQSCSKGNLSANAVGLAILMSRGLQLHVQKVNKTFGPLERNVRQRAWAACLQMEATSSAMLYRQTTSTDEDFDPSGFPEPFDDEDLGKNSAVARGEDSSPKKIRFFIEVVKLFAIKCRILRSLYDLQNPKSFPHAHDVLVLEEQLLLWHQAVPEYLKDPSKTPVDGPYKLQAHVLLNRYTNCRILLYRPFLFFFCATPGGTYPLPDSLKFNLARKSASVCAEAAVELIERVVQTWKGIMIGWWWMSLGQVYSSCLVLLANRIVDRSQPESSSPTAQAAAAHALRSAYDFLIELGWESTNGVTSSGSPTEVRYPPDSVQSTARRCYRILLGIDRAIKSPKPEIEGLNANGSSQRDQQRNPSLSKSDDSSKTNRTAGGTSVPPSRYARRPDPSIPPLRLTASTTNAFDDDSFVASWVGLMQPSFRDETFVPESFSPPSAPFDLATRTLNQNGQSNADDQPQWQNWASLLGTGYLSNFGAGDPLSLQEGEGMGSMFGGSQAFNRPFPNQSMGGPEGMGSTGGLGYADMSGGADGGGHRAEEVVGGRDGRGRAQQF